MRSLSTIGFVASNVLCVLLVVCVSTSVFTSPMAWGGVIVTSTMVPADLKDALNTGGLPITSVSTQNGTDGQFGTYTNFIVQPITIGNGVVLSSGNVGSMAPPADQELAGPQPSYDMATSGTAEFDDYGPGHIENFQSSNDVAALQVNFHLDDTSQIQFDFVFGSVEYPFWTSQYTDSFLAFLKYPDGTTHQITFDKNGKPVQVGLSFAGLVSVADQNTAFADPHGILGLTTTSAELDSGDYSLTFEIGDVNDHILDSAVFISNLRLGVGVEGTEPTDPSDYIVPEPGSIALAAIGFGLLGLNWRGKKASSTVAPQQNKVNEIPKL